MSSSPSSNSAGCTTPFQNLLNFRDVGKTINGFMGEKIVVEGKLFRSARPDDATLRDRRILREEYSINTIIDLRTKTEHANRLKKRQGDLKVPALLQSNEALAQPMEIAGVQYLQININGKGFERSLLWKLKPWSFVKLVFFIMIGMRMRGIAIMGREVMLPRGLIGLGYDSIDHCGLEIAEALRAYTKPSNYPIMAHCTQGKDRTGLIITIILLLLKVPVKAITYDYRMSETELLPEKEARMKEIRSIGLDEHFATCPEDWVEQMETHLDEKYSGVHKYCRSIGYTEEEEMELLQILRA